MATTREPLDVLQAYWGYDSFRPLQAEIIQAALQGTDALALLPTGGGKSLCYQVPALCQEGMCLVVSPLIALMKDQVDNLKKRDISAAAIYSGMTARAIDIVLENACNGEYKLLYVSPERLQTDLLKERAKRMDIRLLAVDEAHCISQWGYDFRPSYLEIAEFRTRLGPVPILALTATATPDVVDDIQEKLSFESPQVFQQSFLRSNLSYSVLYESRKREKLNEILRNVKGTGIVYMRSRRETREIAEWLVKKGISADFYHAGLSSELRSQKQQAWMENRIRVMVCTNAFGMGIDKPDVRIVVHLALPDSLEAYFQEAGRAGRDGKKSYAVLLFQPEDADRLRQQLEAAYPEIDFVKRVYLALGSYTQLAIGAGAGESFNFELQEFCKRFDFKAGVAHAALQLLEQDGLISMNESAASPAKVHITASREALYDYQLRNKKADLLIKAMLRAYPGVNQDFVSISERSLSNLINGNVDQVQAVLRLAQQENMLEYQPAQDKPQLIFLQARMRDHEIRLDIEKYQFRKDRSAVRIAEAVKYAETLKCRSQLLLTYFGEKDSKPCGICDVCTGRNKSEETEAIQQYVRKIQLVLHDEALEMDELFKAFAHKRHPLVLNALQYMLDEGMAVEEEGKIRLLNQ